MELEPPPAKKLRGGENGETHLDSNEANAESKAESKAETGPNGEGKMDPETNRESKVGKEEEVGIEEDKKKTTPVKSVSGAAFKSDSKISVKGRQME